MPIEAYEKLTASQRRLAALSEEIRQTFSEIKANKTDPGRFKDADRRYNQLQREWDFAFHEFMTAMDAFSLAVTDFQLRVEAQRFTRSETPSSSEA